MIDEDWLSDFADVTRREILKKWGPSSCVASTRIGLEVLRYFSVKGVPEVVKVAVFTPTALAAWQEGKLSTDTDGHSIGIAGTGAVTTNEYGRKMWDGHLVIRLLDEPRLVDLSADQMNRLHKGLVLDEPLVTPVFDLDQWRPGEPLILSGDGNGLTFIYEPIHETALAGYKKAADWTGRKGDVRATVGDVIRLLR